MGCVISDNQITLGDEKLTKIQDAPAPTTKRQVRSYMRLTGLTGNVFHTKQNYGHVAVSLTYLTKKVQSNIMNWH
jgi:hypothetical protein